MFKRLAVTVLVLCLVGCASGPDTKSEWQSALSLEQMGSLDEALAYIDSAIAKDPSKTEYLLKKDQLQRAIVSRLISTMEPLLSAGLVNLEEVNKVTVNAQRVRGLYPSEETTKVFSAAVDAAVSAFYEASDETLAAATALVDRGEWGEAFYELSELLEKNPDADNAVSLMDKIRGDGVASMIDSALEQMDAENIATALATLTVASDIDGNSSEIRLLLNEVSGKDNEAYYRGAIATRMAQKEWDKVLLLCRASDRFDGLVEPCMVARDKADFDRQDQLILKVESLLKQRRLIGAFDSYTQAKEINLPEFDRKMLSLGDTLKDKITAAAKKMTKQGRYGVAWVLYQRIDQLESQYSNIKNLEDKIFARIKKLIAVYDFTSPKDSADAGIIVANNLISRLFVSSSKDVSILERESLKTILEEMKLAQIGLVSESDSQEIGKIYGIDIAIMGSVLRYRVDQTDSTNRKTARVKTGEKIEDNIEFLNWKASNSNASNAELKNAPQAKVMVPQYENISYEVKSVKKVGFVELAFRIVDSSTGETIKVKTLERTKIFTDSANEGLDMAGVVFDALDIPTNTQVLKLITQSIVDELVAEVLSPIQNLESQYLEDGERFLKRRENLAAAEKLVDSVFDVRLKSIANSPVAAKAEQLIDRSLVNFQF